MSLNLSVWVKQHHVSRSQSQVTNTQVTYDFMVRICLIIPNVFMRQLLIPYLLYDDLTFNHLKTNSLSLFKHNYIVLQMTFTV